MPLGALPGSPHYSSLVFCTSLILSLETLYLQTDRQAYDVFRGEAWDAVQLRGVRPLDGLVGDAGPGPSLVNDGSQITGRARGLYGEQHAPGAEDAELRCAVCDRRFTDDDNFVGGAAAGAVDPAIHGRSEPVDIRVRNPREGVAAAGAEHSAVTEEAGGFVNQ